MGYHAHVKREKAKRMQRAMTPAETILWDAIRINRLAGLDFRRQQVIDGFIADSYCHAARLVIEVDGRIHEETADYDRERDRILATRGLRILRFKNDHIAQNLPHCLQEILRAAHARRDLPLPDSGSRVPSGQVGG